MRITYSPRALRDLIEIGNYLSARNPRGAAQVEQRIRMIVQLIADFPASGRAVASRPAVRAIPLGTYPYTIFYLPRNEELIVLHIRHSARQPIDPSVL